MNAAAVPVAPSVTDPSGCSPFGVTAHVFNRLSPAPSVTTSLPSERSAIAFIPPGCAITAGVIGVWSATDHKRI